MKNQSHLMQWLAQRPYLIAVAISLILILWMASGIMTAPSPAQPADKTNNQIAKVQVTTMHAQLMNDSVQLYGRTEPDRITTLKAELAGTIENVEAQRGAQVTKGQVIARIALNDLPAQLERSKALLKQRQVEFQGIKKLNADGYQGEVELASAAAQLAEIKAEITRLEIAIKQTVIRAPYDGVLNTRYVEQGDYVQSGDPIAVVADLDPIVVRAFVTEKQVQQIELAQQAQVSLLNERQLMGKVRYIASIADQQTNTFKIEVAIDNHDSQLLAGLSSELNIGFKKVNAIKLSPALLALDEQGNIGVKTVQNNQVLFTEINVVKNEPDGLWLTGLGEQADVISLGQGFVRAGDKVEAVFKNLMDEQIHQKNHQPSHHQSSTRAN